MSLRPLRALRPAFQPLRRLQPYKPRLRTFRAGTLRLQQDQSLIVTDLRVRSRFSWWNVGRYALYTLLIWKGTTFVFSRFFEIEVVDTSKTARNASTIGGNEAQEELDVELDDEDSIFIPLLLPYKLPDSYYRDSDIEWQEFKKLSKDRERKKRVADELIEKVFTGVKKHAQLARKLGKDVKVTKTWLDFVFPDMKSPQYARTGIEWASNYIAIAEQTIPNAEYLQVSNVIYPKAVFSACRSTIRVLYQTEKVKFKQRLGMSLAPKELHILRLMGNIGAELAKVDAEEGASTEKTLQEQKSSGPWWSWKPALPNLSLPAQVALAYYAFVHDLSINLNKATKDRLPPGCCVIKGHILIQGSQSAVRLNVQASYNPKTSEFMHVDAGIYSLFELSQRAKGGP